jgi:hypothetical protein
MNLFLAANQENPGPQLLSESRRGNRRRICSQPRATAGRTRFAVDQLE